MSVAFMESRARASRSMLRRTILLCSGIALVLFLGFPVFEPLLYMWTDGTVGLSGSLVYLATVLALFGVPVAIWVSKVETERGRLYEELQRIAEEAATDGVAGIPELSEPDIASAL